MSGLFDKDGKPVPERSEPRAKCDDCGHVARVSKFLGDEPDEDQCPSCSCRLWTFV